MLSFAKQYKEPSHLHHSIHQPKTIEHRVKIEEIMSMKMMSKARLVLLRTISVLEVSFSQNFLTDTDQDQG